MYVTSDLEFFRNRPLDRSVPIPAYYQLTEILQEYVDTHEHEFPVPAESELCEIYGISRPTVRQALQSLTRMGLILRFKGRGSFINKKKIEQDFLLHITSFHDEMEAKGLKPETSVLNFCSRRSTPHVVEKLALPSATEVIFLSRVRSINGEPIVLVNTYLAPELVPGILAKDMQAESLYHVIERDFGHRIARTVRSLEIRRAGKYEASLLGIAEGEPVHFTETVAFIEDGQPIELSMAYYNGERNKFTIEIVNHRR